MKEFWQRIWETKIKVAAREVYYFLSSLLFLKNFAAMIAAITAIVFTTFWWMKCYTNHGESIQVQNYIGLNLEEAEAMAKSRSFQLIINDSIYIVGKQPTEILEQNPKPLSRVKENRKIYVTISKKIPDQVPLPDLTGGNDDFNQYRRKLSRLDINAKIIERKFNNKLEPNTILDILFEGEKITDQVKTIKIPKGSTLEFIVTERSGGRVPVPELVCKRYEDARFLITNLNLN